MVSAPKNPVNEFDTSCEIKRAEELAIMYPIEWTKRKRERAAKWTDNRVQALFLDSSRNARSQSRTVKLHEMRPHAILNPFGWRGICVNPYERKTFTPEEVALLRGNKYVKNATIKTMALTKEGKQRFWEEYRQGKFVGAILAGMGFDTEMLGSRRMYGIRASIVASVERGEDFRDTRRRLVKQADESEALCAGPVAYMEHRLAYLEQEVEFIKKIISVEREAEQRCSSKEDPKRSSRSSKK